jgi:hypothetical protein
MSLLGVESSRLNTSKELAIKLLYILTFTWHSMKEIGWHTIVEIKWHSI